TKKISSLFDLSNCCLKSKLHSQSKSAKLKSLDHCSFRDSTIACRAYALQHMLKIFSPSRKMVFLPLTESVILLILISVTTCLMIPNGMVIADFPLPSLLVYYM